MTAANHDDHHEWPRLLPAAAVATTATVTNNNNNNPPLLPWPHSLWCSLLLPALHSALRESQEVHHRDDVPDVQVDTLSISYEVCTLPVPALYTTRPSHVGAKEHICTVLPLPAPRHRCPPLLPRSSSCVNKCTRPPPTVHHHHYFQAASLMNPVNSMDSVGFHRFVRARARAKNTTQMCHFSLQYFPMNHALAWPLRTLGPRYL